MTGVPVTRRDTVCCPALPSVRIITLDDALGCAHDSQAFTYGACALAPLSGG